MVARIVSAAAMPRRMSPHPCGMPPSPRPWARELRCGGARILVHADSRTTEHYDRARVSIPGLRTLRKLCNLTNVEIAVNVIPSRRTYVADGPKNKSP